MQIKNRLISTSIIILILLTFLSFNPKKDKDKENITVPLSYIKIDDNLYANRYEVSNLSWLEYQNWVNEVYKRDANKIKASKTDPQVFNQVAECLEIGAYDYIFDLSYGDHPVVGITQQQAKDYNQWRSDFTTFFYLFQTGHFNEDFKPDEHKDFSVEAYLRGDYDFYLKKEKIDFYYHFKLPNKEERQKLFEFSKKAANEYFESSKKKKVKECMALHPQLVFNIDPCASGNKKFIPSKSWNHQCILEYEKSLIHVQGNVAEWLEEENTVAGGSWKTVLIEEDIDIIEEIEAGANAWTGFRSVLTIEKVK